MSRPGHGLRTGYGKRRTARCQKVGRDAQNLLHIILLWHGMAKVSALIVGVFSPAWLAETIGSGTDHLIPAGIPLDLASITAVGGIKSIASGVIVNRLWANQATQAFKLWDGTGTPEALEEFYIVPWAVDDLSNEAACNAVRWQTLIYEDRLPASYQAIPVALKATIRNKYQMILARKVAL